VAGVRRALVSICVVVTGTAAVGSASAATLVSPEASRIGQVTAPIRDTVLSATNARRLAAVPGTFWGGPFTASTGETVQIQFSTSYPQDPALGQKWADFLAGLVHGSELPKLTLYLEPLSDVQRLCGRAAAACYSDRDSTIVAPGDALPDGTSAEAVLTHEYGHHVAASRDNSPWPAIDWGTKRWATYEQICTRAGQRALFPGDEGPNYTLNPGEAFAESYRVLNERLQNLPEPPWDVVDASFTPDDTALQLVEQDVLQPWAGPTVSTISGSFTRQGRTRAYSVADELDGTVRVTLATPRTGKFSLAVAGSPPSRTVASGGGRRTVSTTACGSRTLSLTVSRVSGFGPFRLIVTKP
jgi:hypothetical protein